MYFSISAQFNISAGDNRMLSPVVIKNGVCPHSGCSGALEEQGNNEREERTNMRQQTTTSNKFVAVATFSRQYILTGSYRVHCKKALRQASPPSFFSPKKMKILEFFF